MVKKIIQTIIITVLIIVALVILVPFLVIGGPVVAEMLFDRPSKPEIKYAEFPFELVYEYDGEQYTIEESIICDYEGIKFTLDGGNYREWDCTISDHTLYGQYYLDEAKHPTLYIQIPLEGDYWMGDPNFNEEFATPYLFFIDERTGTTYYEQDLSKVIGAKIISWKPSKVLEGNIK